MLSRRNMGNPATKHAGRKTHDDRSIEELEQDLNLHDLSEVPLKEGSIAPGMLIRCATLDELTTNEWQALTSAHRLGLVVDLRGQAEIPERFGVFASSAKSACVPCATVNLHLEGLGLLMPKWQRSFGPAWVRMRRKLWADPETIFKKMYAALVLDADNQQNMGRFFAFALMPYDGAFAWHCAQGTDRTGIMAALLLEVLGAERNTIVEHYAACYAHGTPADPRPQLLAAYEAIEGSYGSVEAYLTDALGVTAAMQENLRERFLL